MPGSLAYEPRAEYEVRGAAKVRSGESSLHRPRRLLPHRGYPVRVAVRALGSELDNTYIVVLTSDNGVYLGEHRLEEKAAAYNAAPRIPLVIRGPGVPKG